MTRDLVVVGAGGFGRETLDVVEALDAAGDVAPFRLLGVVDDAPSALNLQRLADRGVSHLGGVDQLERRPSGTAYVVAIGHPATRRSLVERLDAAGLRPATLVHPGATIGSRVVLAEGVVVCGGVQVSTNVRLGRHVHVNPHATLGHDAELHDFVSVNPAATVSGECRLETGSHIGSSAVVLQGLTVGADSVVGACACVVADVPSGRTVKGVPAR